MNMNCILHQFLLLGLLLNQSAVASVAEHNFKWNKKTIRVCWGAHDDVLRAEVPNLTRQLLLHSEFDSINYADKLQVQETITREYSLNSVGIELVGWENCEKDDPSDVIVFSEDLTKAPKHLTDLIFAASYHGCSSIGDDSPGSLLKRFVHIKKIPEYKLTLSSEQALDLVALHEFGHLVGLRHEHARRFDAEKDSNCYTQELGLLEVVGKTAQLYSVYDPNSIMNYCHDLSLMTKTGNDFYVDGLSELNLSLVVGGSSFAGKTISPEKLFSVNEVNFIDGSLITKTPDQDANAVHYEVKIGLSSGDRHTLRCLYNASYDQQNCNAEFNPLSHD